MNRSALTIAFAGLLGLAGPAIALAGVILTTTSFTGTTTDYTTAVSSQQFLGTTPFTDSDGRTVSGDGFLEPPGSGFALLPDNATTPLELTWTGLAANTQRVGFDFDDLGANITLVSAKFSNGDVYNATTPALSGFIGFIDTKPFTSIELDFLNDGSPSLNDFTTAAAANNAVPEPSTLTSVATGALVAAGAAAAAARRRRARRGEAGC